MPDDSETDEMRQKEEERSDGLSSCMAGGHARSIGHPSDEPTEEITGLQARSLTPVISFAVSPSECLRLNCAN